MIPTGKPAPGFSLPDLNGNPHRLGDYRGRIVVVNFWSAECPWSERTDKELGAFLEAWGSKVVVLPVASNASEVPEMLAQAAEARGVPLVLRDAEQEVAKLYGAQTTPHVFVVDSEGVLRYQGAFDDTTFRQLKPTRNYLREAVDALLSGGEPDPSEAPPYGCTVVYHPLE